MELTKELYRPSEVAKLIQVSPDTIRYWIYEGKIPSEHIVTLPSGHKRIRRTGVVELLQQKGIDTNNILLFMLEKVLTIRKKVLHVKLHNL